MSPIGSIQEPQIPTQTPKVKKLPSRKKISGTGLMSASDIAGIEYPMLEITGKWKNLLGDPAYNVWIMLWGKGGQGKTTAAIQLARQMAIDGHNVLYVSGEQYGSLSLKQNIMRQGGAVDGLYFAKDVSSMSKDFNVFVFDSVNNMKLDMEWFLKNVREKYPDAVIITIHQATKEGNFKGAQEWQHECDVVLQVFDGMAFVDGKNRYGAESSEIEVFKSKNRAKQEEQNEAQEVTSKAKSKKKPATQGSRPDALTELLKQSQALINGI